MATRTGRSALGLVVSLGMLAGGCSDVSDQFIIVQNQVPQAGCTISTDRTLYRGAGLLDVALVGPIATAAYRLHPLLVNGLPKVGQSGVQPNRITMRGFRVNIQLAANAPAALQELFGTVAGSEQARLLDYEERWSTTIDPGGGTVATSVTAVPGELARLIAGTKALEKVTHANLDVTVRALGRTEDGSAESEPFRYPVRVCAGCLVSDLRPCPYKAVNTGNACNVAQDDPVDCCTEGRSMRCPASAPDGE